jgi:hypothetical protein
VATFINFSGGLDSTYFLWRWLKENTGHIVVHHCYYSSRRDMEKKACDNVLNELKRLGLSHFTYRVSQAKFDTKPDRDIIVMATMGAFVARRYTIQDVLLCYSKEESAEMDAHLKKVGSISGFSRTHRYAIANQLFQSIYRKNVVRFFFLEQEGGLISRKRMVEELPDELLRHVSFCRNPKEERPFCGACFTCKRTVQYIKQAGKLHLWKQPTLSTSAAGLTAPTTYGNGYRKIQVRR